MEYLVFYLSRLFYLYCHWILMKTKTRSGYLAGRHRICSLLALVTSSQHYNPRTLQSFYCVSCFKKYDNIRQDCVLCGNSVNVFIILSSLSEYFSNNYLHCRSWYMIEWTLLNTCSYSFQVQVSIAFIAGLHHFSGHFK